MVQGRTYCLRRIRSGEVSLMGVPLLRVCHGLLRTLYIRRVEEGRTVGWQPVGKVCSRCHNYVLWTQEIEDKNEERDGHQVTATWDGETYPDPQDACHE